MFFRKKQERVSFEDARKVLLILLADVGEDRWRAKLAEVSSWSFKSVLGGMGSFNDLCICAENNHRITDEKEPLANELLQCLTEVCYVTARRGALPAADLDAVCGSDGAVLIGYRCLACGYPQVPVRNVRALLAPRDVRHALRSGMDEVLCLWKGVENTKIIQDTVSVIRKNGVHSVGDVAGIRHCCPSCESDHTCVYRWRLENSLLVPTADDLPLRFS
jgi:hypothetical protein